MWLYLPNSIGVFIRKRILYGHGSLVINIIGQRRSHRLKLGACLTTRAALKKGKTVFQKGMKWIVGMNSNLSFWHDKWLSDGTFRSLIVGPFQRGEDSLLLKDVIQYNFWDLARLSFTFPSALVQKIKATPFPLVATSVDRISWTFSPNGDFELKEAYRLACLTDENPHCSLL